MPDWFYRTVSQPVLFRLPAEKARNLALGFMGRLARLPDRAERPAELSWLWTLLMGGGMLFGSLLALTIAATRVVLSCP